MAVDKVWIYFKWLFKRNLFAITKRTEKDLTLLQNIKRKLL